MVERPVSTGVMRAADRRTDRPSNSRTRMRQLEALESDDGKIDPTRLRITSVRRLALPTRQRPGSKTHRGQDAGLLDQRDRRAMVGLEVATSGQSTSTQDGRCVFQCSF